MNLILFAPIPSPKQCLRTVINQRGHIITGDFSTVENKVLRELLSKGPEYRQPKSFAWKRNSTLIMD